jgi:hypothetical protein
MKSPLFFALLLISLASKAQLTNNLVAMFPFDGNYNEQQFNATSVTNNGTTFTNDRNGVSNHGLYFGYQNYLAFNNPSVKVQLPITLSVWVNVNSFNAINDIFRSDNVFNNYYGYCLNISQGTGQVGVHISGGLGGANSANRRSFITTNGITLNSWHHIVAIIRSATDMEIYIDCTLQNGSYSGTGSMNMTYSNSESRIGGYIGNSTSTNGLYFDGKMDQFVIWDRELTIDEISRVCDLNSELSASELSKSGIFLCYPSPVNDVLILENNHSTTTKFTLSNLEGKKMFSDEIASNSEQKLNLGYLPAGVYLLYVTIDSRTTIQKIVKQ